MTTLLHARRILFDSGFSVADVEAMEKGLEIYLDTYVVRPVRVATEARLADLNIVLASIIKCRQAQDVKWGGPEHDDLHSWSDWSQYIQKFVDRSVGAGTPADFETQMIHIAALACAAVESSCRKRLMWNHDALRKREGPR